VTSTGPTDATNSEAIERTAQNLVTCINGSTTPSTVWAYYAADPNGLPGKIRIEYRTGVTGFTALASAHGNAYRPSLAAAVTAVADIYPNGFAFSKPNQGDAVPRVNLGRLGREDTALLRQVPLRDALFQFTDAGLYRLTGRDFNEFQSQEFDLSFRLIGREMVCVCDDYIYAWGYEGIARISSAGVEYISNAIEPLVWDAINTVGFSWISTYGWAAAYRGRHKVVFAVPTTATAGGGVDNTKNAPSMFVFDTRMEAWTKWVPKAGTDTPRTQGYSCGAVRQSDDVFFFGQWTSGGGDTSVYKERLTYTAADFKDDTFNQTDQAIAKAVTWNIVTDSPELATHWQDLHILFDVSSVFAAWTTPTALTALFTSDRASTSASISIAPTATSRKSICGIPTAQRRSASMQVALSHITASEYFGLEGMVLIHLPGEGTATVRT
jgi:hypothetical protein